MTRPRITSLNVTLFVPRKIYFEIKCVLRSDRDAAHLPPDWQRDRDVHQPRDQRLPRLQEHQGQGHHHYHSAVIIDN